MSDAPLVHGRGRHFAVAAEATAILWIGTTALVALGDGTVRRLAIEDEPETLPAHHGAILSACRHPDGASIVTGGDDGRVLHIVPGEPVRELAAFESKWVEHLAASPTSGLIVAAVGREAVVWTKGATEPSHRFAFGSTIGGLALDGKGKRLAVAHYNGATLLYGANAGSGRIELSWIGSHLACATSRDGTYLVTALQETGLHGWQLPAIRDMRMSGYAAKTKSFSWSRRDRWLATSGGADAIVWPFEGKTGPMGKAPAMLGKRDDALVTRVAFHPADDMLAMGYSDGAVAIGRLADGATVAVDEPASAITALSWNDAGTRLAWGDEDGRVGLLDMAARA